MLTRPWRATLTTAGALIVAGAIVVALNQGFSGDTQPPAAAPAPATSSPAPQPSRFDVQRLLPVSRTELEAAAQQAQRFVAAYGTWRYDQTADAYLGRLLPLAAPQLHGELRYAAATPGIVEQRQIDREVATCQAAVTEARSIQKKSVIFVVTGTQHITGRAPRTRTSRYAVTLTRTLGRWLVYAIEPAEDGQAGDSPR